MWVLLPKVLIFISLGRGVKQWYQTFKQQKEFIKIFFVVDLQISPRE